MRGQGLWECTSGVVLTFSALLGQDVLVSASHMGRNPLQQIQQLQQQRRDADVIHRVPKAQITPPPVVRGDVLRRLEGATCATEHHMCPPEMNGGCCPDRYACAFDSCYATTAGPTTACGKANYFACADSALGGCCPVGYICGERKCEPPADASAQETNCPASYTLCPASASFGCCKEGYACAINGCYKTEPYGTTVVRTFTSTSSGSILLTTATITSTATPSAPVGVPASENAKTVVKFIPTSVPKIAAIQPTEPASGGGLSGGAIGGIVAGIVILLVVVVAAAFFIIRRVNKVRDEIVESKKGGSDMPKSHSKTASQVHQMEVDGGQLHYNPPYEDDIGIDSLIQSNTSAAGTPAPFYDPNSNNRGRSESNPAGGFTPSPNMFPTYDEPNRSRHASPEPDPGWFDSGNVPPGAGVQNNQPMRPAPIRQSSGSQGDAYGNYQYTQYTPYSHNRNQSDASELSADGGSDRGGASPHIIPELAASGGFAAELPGQHGVRSRSSSNTSARGQYRNHPMHHSRQRSDSNMSDGQQGVPQGGAQGLGLSPLDEEGTDIHGYYGRRDQQAGQTAAGLGEVEWDMSSPVDPGYVPRPYPKDQPGGGR
ncbi:hypothetical protein QC762_309180 [Podospora pseudocomata]|uniref:Mid2 domain-containing protein n=1 Tax=Podospora pseudocomata TaxID=2093779 RepID=A0ABR0GKP4_9PEZI|nr:hypothetical protein QC762_309180 [Podospora pseudocomata]